MVQIFIYNYTGMYFPGPLLSLTSHKISPAKELEHSENIQHVTLYEEISFSHAKA